MIDRYSPHSCNVERNFLVLLNDLYQWFANGVAKRGPILLKNPKTQNGGFSAQAIGDESAARVSRMR
jgi:hypothetical protein